MANAASWKDYAPANGLKIVLRDPPDWGTTDPAARQCRLDRDVRTVLSRLAEPRQVIGVDLQAGGRTADIDRPLRYEAMTDDIVAQINYLGIDRADIMDYSLGGGVAMRTAIQFSKLVRRLVAVSAPFKRDGWYPDILAGIAQSGSATAEAMKQPPLYRAYSATASKPEDWPVALQQTQRFA